MKFSAVKRYRRRHRLLGALLLRNPVLVMGLDLPFVIAAATSLRNALAMSLLLLVIHMVTMSVALYTRRRLPMWLRTVVTVCVSTLVMMLMLRPVLFLFRGIYGSLGIYLYLMAVNSMTILQANHLDRRTRPGTVLLNAALNAVGFAIVAVLVGALREYFGNGTLWGVPLAAPMRISGLLIPFSGFILMGFLLALARFLNKRILMLLIRENERKEKRYSKIRIDSVETIDI